MLHDTALHVARAARGPVLALDTSTDTALLALAVDHASKPLHEDTLPSRALPSEGLFERMVALLAAASVPAQALRAIVVGLGPGSFTGLRVGLASAKGLALATGAAVYGAQSFAWHAAGTAPGRVWVVRDARRQSLYTACFDVGADAQVKTICAEQCLPEKEAKAQLLADATAQGNIRLLGDVAESLAEQLGAAHAQAVDTVLRPGAAFALCRHRIEQQQVDDVTTLEPLYLQTMPVPAAKSFRIPV